MSAERPTKAQIDEQRKRCSADTKMLLAEIDALTIERDDAIRAEKEPRKGPLSSFARYQQSIIDELVAERDRLRAELAAAKKIKATEIDEIVRIKERLDEVLGPAQRRARGTEEGK